MIEIILNIALPVFLILLAMVVGSLLEKRHFRSISKREQDFSGLPVLSSRDYPRDRNIQSSEMYMGSAVVSVDYFKRLLAGLRMIFGGELGAYASLLDRARREAVLRLLEQCQDADMVISLRIETSSVFKGRTNRIGSTEILAYGTAIHFASR